MLNELLVAVLRVDEVGGLWGAKWRIFGALLSPSEIEGWVTEERVYDELRGAAQSVRALVRGVAHWLGGWRLLTP